MSFIHVLLPVPDLVYHDFGAKQTKMHYGKQIEDRKFLYCLLGVCGTVALWCSSVAKGPESVFIVGR